MRKGNEFGGGRGLDCGKTLMQEERCRLMQDFGWRTRWNNTHLPKASFRSAGAFEDTLVGEEDSCGRGVKRDYTARIAELSHGEE